MWVFVFQKYGKFWSISLEHFIKHKPLISEEWDLKVQKYHFHFPPAQKTIFQFCTICIHTVCQQPWSACSLGNNDYDEDDETPYFQNTQLGDLNSKNVKYLGKSNVFWKYFWTGKCGVSEKIKKKPYLPLYYCTLWLH